MKIYLSGPITGTKDYMNRFAEAEQRLTERGHSVINPARVCACLPKDTTYEEYMEMCMTMMGQAEAIYLMAGWQDSNGARREFETAKIWKIKIFYEGAESWQTQI